MPFVSIIIPAYNSAATIGETLRSLDAQEYRDFETIVVDDGSQDNTAAIVERDFPSVRVLRQANGGPAAARNAGARQATGDWLAFLDADDAWLPWRLAMQIQLAGEHPEFAMWCGETVGLEEAQMGEGRRVGGSECRGIGGTGCRSNQAPSTTHEGKISKHPASSAATDYAVASQTPSTKNAQRPTQNPQPSSHARGRSAPCSALRAPFAPLPLAAFGCVNPVATSTVLIRRDVFEATGGFDRQFRGPEDYDLWMRVAGVAKIAKIAAPLSRYREELGSLSMDERRFLPEVMRVLDKAYGRDGALHGVGRKRQAQAIQYVHASWMAYRRGNRVAALAHLLKSLLRWPWPLPKPRWKYLIRYLLRS